MRQPARRHALLIACFALVGFVMLYWPLFHSGTHVPGNRVTDYHLAHWSMWWMRHAFTTGADVYLTNYVMFPGVTNLAYHTLGMAWYPLWALLEPLVGTLAAFNVIFWLAATLRGYVFYLFLRHERLPAGMALFGGVLLQVMPTAFGSIFWSNVNMLGWFWLPLHLLLWSAVARALDWRRRLLWALLLGLAFWAAALTDLQFLLFTAFLLVPYGLLTLFEVGRGDGTSRRSPLPLVVAGAVAVAVFVALLWFAGPLRALFSYDRGGFLAADINAVERIDFPQGFLGRSEIYWLHPSVGLLWTFLILGALAVSLDPQRRKAETARRWFWFVVMLPPLILSLGPDITLFGLTIPMPYALLHDLLGGTFRYPGRLAPVFLMAGLVFAGLALRPYWLRLRAPLARPLILAALLLLLFADLHVFESVPVTLPVTPYDFYTVMGQEQGDPYDDYVVVEVPVAAGTGVQWIGNFDDTALQFYGLTHGKRMVNGLLSRTNSDYFWVLRTADPVLSWLGGRRWLEPDVVEADLRGRIDAWPIGYIVVHQDRIGREGPTVQEILGYFNSLGDDVLCPFAVEGEAVAYRTAWHPDGCQARIPPETAPGVYTVDVGSSGDERFIGWGWHWPERVFDVTLRWIGDQRWTADDPRADLYVDLPPDDYTVTVAAQAFWEAREMTLRINGAVVGTATVPLELSELSFEVPAALIGDGEQLQVTLAYDTWAVPAEVGQSADERLLSLAVDWVAFEAAP